MGYLLLWGYGKVRRKGKRTMSDQLTKAKYLKAMRLKRSANKRKENRLKDLQVKTNK
jgi:hypothetical protein